MHPWFGKAAVLAAIAVLIVIRAPHGQRSRSVKVVRSARGPLEVFLLTVAWISVFIPLFWVSRSWPEFANYPLHPVPWAVGLVLIAWGLWLFHRSHADLGRNWSITLQIREDHQLVTEGVYRRIRHPMYSSLLLWSVGLALVLPNWIAGPSYLFAVVLLVAFRVGPEERMMRERFGPAYDDYAAKTDRIVPGVW